MFLRPRKMIALSLLISLSALAACGGGDTTSPINSSATSDPADLVSEPKVSLPDASPTKLVITDLTRGSGDGAKSGDTVLVFYVGVLTKDGTRFDGNFGADPFSVTLGKGSVIKGWDEGLIGIKKGGRRQLDIPADLAYGDQGSGDVIKAGEAISFIVDAVTIVPAVDPADEPKIDLKGGDPVTKVVTKDLKKGKGDEAVVGGGVLVNILAYNAATGELITSTWGDPSPVQLMLIEGKSLPGLLKGIPGMKVGGRRQITIPYADAFGEAGNSDLGLPAKTDLIIVLDLLATY